MSVGLALLFAPVSLPTSPVDGESSETLVLLVESARVDGSGLAAVGGSIVADYGNGLLLVRWPASLTPPKTADPMPGRTKVRLDHSRISFDTSAGEPTFPSELQGSSDAHLLQFLGPIRGEWIEELRALGLDFDQYFANYAFVVRGTRSALEVAREKPYVAWTGPYHAGYKVTAALLERDDDVPVFVVGFPSESPRAIAEHVESVGGRVEAMWDLPPTVTATVSAAQLPTLARNAAILAIEERSGFVPLDRVTGRIHGYHAAWSPSRSGLPSSLTGRSAGPDGLMYNADDYFEGVGIQDTGFADSDPNDGPLDFFDSPNGDRVLRLFRHSGPTRDGKCGSAHGTHVVGIVAGDGYASERDAFEDRGDTEADWTDKEWRRSEAGVAPEALVSLDGVQSGNDFICGFGLLVNLAYWDCQYLNGYIAVPVTSGVSSAICGAPWTDGADIATHNAGIDAGSRAFVTIHSNSWGSSGSTYGVIATGADTRSNAAPERLLVFAAGNSGPQPNTLIPEALLKNGISVGAVQTVRPEWFESDDPDVVAGFSSRGGPAMSNGRIKPDLVAVGSTVLSLYGVGETLADPARRFIARFHGLPPGADGRWDLDKQCGSGSYCFSGDGVPDYRYYEGTSFATPHASGSAILVREYLREVVAENNASSPYFNAPSYLVKAILINGAVRMDPSLYPYPGYDQGWGRIDLEQSLFPPPPRTNQFEIGSFTTTGTWSPSTVNTNVSSARVPLKVTLVWLDQPGDALARDLDLILRAPSGAVYHGNQYSGGWTDPAGTGFDRINNVEQVEAREPEVGTWSVEVRGVSIPTAARFALVFSADVGPRASYDVGLALANPVVQIAPSGSALIPVIARNFGTDVDDLLLAASVPPGADAVVSFYPGASVTLGSDEAQVVIAAVTADASAVEGAYDVELRAVSSHDPRPAPAADAAMIRVEVRTGPLPSFVPIANGPSDEQDPSLLAFDDGGTSRLFVAYRKTEPVSADRRTGGSTVWTARTTLGTDGRPDAPFTHERVNDENEDPTDLRLLQLPSGTYAGRVVLTWTGRDPASGLPWSRIAHVDPPYSGPWTVGTIQVNEGTFARPCNLARMGVPLFRASGGGQLVYVWESLEGDCTFSVDYASVYAKTSPDGGATWGPLEVVFAGDYFAPSGVVDQNDVVWVFAAGAIFPSSRADVFVRLFDDAGWSVVPSTYRILDTTDNFGFPSAFSTDEGPSGNRVYVAATRDAERATLRAFTAFTDGDYTSGTPPRDTNDSASPGVPCGVGCFLSVDFSPPSGSGLMGPFGGSLALGSFDRGPVLQVASTIDVGGRTGWLLARETATPFGSPNVHARYSADGFPTSTITTLTADGFPKGHPSVAAHAVAGVGRLYVAYHASRGVVTDHDYDVYLSVVRDGWWTEPDGLGPIVTAVAGTPNPVSPSGVFRITASADDAARGGSDIAAAEYSLNGSAGPWSAMTGWDIFDSSTEGAFADLDASLLGWSFGECHEVLVHAADSAGNWGPEASFEECTTLVAPPAPPIVLSVALRGASFSDVEITWEGTPDEGGSFGATAYRVDRAVWPSAAFDRVADIPATGSAVYAWTDGSGGDGDPNVYLYRVFSVNAFGAESADPILGAKYTRTLGAGWNLVSMPIVPSDLSVPVVFQTLDWTVARTYDGNAADPWKAHVVGASSDFETLDPSLGVWVNVVAPETFTVAGLLPKQRSVDLVEGWNLISFAGLAHLGYTVGDLRAAVPVSIVEGFDPAPPYYLRTLSDEEDLSPGFGYWVFALRAATWEVP